MNILWLIPLYVSTQQFEISQRDFMLSEKNEIARAIREAGHKIKAVVCSDSRQANMDGFTEIYLYIAIKLCWIKKIIYHIKMLNFALSDNYDVILFSVHSSHLIPILKIASFFRRHKGILIMDIRTVPVDLVDDLRSKFELLRYNASVKIADIFCEGITCITPMLGLTLKPRLRKLKNKIGYFQTGVNFKLFDPSSSFSLRDSLGLNNKFIIFHHGVISPNRGIQNIIRAIDICRNRIPEILFMVVGTGSGESELVKIAKDLNVEQNVFFTGGVPFKKIPNYIATADIAIIPLPAIDWWNVSSPIKLKEYLAMQIPVIATDIPAHRHVVEKTGGATLIKDNKPQNIAQAVLAFYKSRNTAYPMRTREELYGIISFNSQALKFLDYVNKL